MEVVGPALLRQALYRFFAALLLYPEQQRLESARIAACWLEEHLADVQQLFGEEATAHVQQILAWIRQPAIALEPLQGEWVRLFGASREGYCYPYEGASAPPEAVPLLLVQLQREYAAAGVALSQNELPDFVGVELEFLSHLCGLELRAEASADEGGQQKLRSARLGFLDRHFCRWMPQLASRVQQHDGGPYEHVCRAVLGIASRDQAQLSASLAGA